MVGNMLSGDFYGFLEPFAPVIDGVEFTEQQIDAFKVRRKKKDIIIGLNTDFESKIFEIFANKWHFKDDQKKKNHVFI